MKMKRNTKKRIIAAALGAIMAIAITSISAFAACTPAGKESANITYTAIDCLKSNDCFDKIDKAIKSNLKNCISNFKDEVKGCKTATPNITGGNRAAKIIINGKEIDFGGNISIWDIISKYREAWNVPGGKAPVETPEKPETPVDKPVENPKPPVETPEKPVVPPTNSSVSAIEREVVALVNQIRASYGLGQLTLNEELSRVARIKAEDMAKKRYFSHNSPTYGSPFDMMRRFGISYRTAGENIAKCYSTAKAVVDAWMNSEGHRANILNPSFSQIGVGYTATGNHWCQMFIG